MKTFILKPMLRYVTLLLFLLPGLGVQAQEKKVTLHLEDVPMRIAMSEIEKQTKYLFGTEEGIDLERKVNLDGKEAPLTSILQQMTAGTNLKFEISGTNIFLSIKKESDKKKKTGTVVDESGEPLPGVVVMLKGTQEATVTDIDGKWALDLPSSGG